MALSLVLDRGEHAPSILIADGHVADVGGAPEPDSQRLDCTGNGVTIAAGDVNAHTHLYSGLAPLGMPPPEPPPESFVQILERVWWRLDRALDEASLRASARLYVAESLRAGTTSLIDHHESPSFIDGSLDVLADAAEEIGVRLLVCYGATERNGGQGEARAGLAECERFIGSNRRPLVRGAVGLHASFTVGDDTVREAGELARRLDTVMHVHMAEDLADVTDARSRGHEGPLERLLGLGALPPGSILAHGVHLTEAQVRRAADAGCWFVHNPRSNEGNRVGYASVLSATDRVALGTDGYPADMSLEVEALARLAHVHRDTCSPAARKAAGLPLAAERLAPGLASDTHRGAPADLVVREQHGGVRHVLVGGRVVVRDGALSSGDMDAIRAEAQNQAASLWQRMGALA